jgi:hypothetical protein
VTKGKNKGGKGKIIKQGMYMVHRLDIMLNNEIESKAKMPQLILHSFSPTLSMFAQASYFKNIVLINTNEDFIVFSFCTLNINDLLARLLHSLSVN